MPAHLAGAIADAKCAEDLGSPILEQLALADLIDSGRLDRHLRRVRGRYHRRRDALAQTLRRLAPNIELTGIAAGLHAVATLAAGADEQHTIAAAAPA